MGNGRKIADHIGSLGFIGILIVNAVFLSRNSFRVFNFYDMGFDLDGGWRILNGQRPFADFICFTGPIHLYAYALFFKLFGFGKPAIFAYLVTSSSLAIGMVWWMTQKALPKALSLALAALTMTSFYWPVSHPWHNQTAMLWAIAALALYVRNLDALNPRRAFWLGLGCGVLVALTFLTKTNEGAVYCLFFFVLFALSPYRVQALSGYAIGGLGSFGLAILLFGCTFQDFLGQITASGKLMAGRRLSRMMVWSNWFANYYWIPFLIVLLNVGPLCWKHREWFALLVGMMVVSVYSLYSNDILLAANIFLWGIFMAVAFLVLYKMREENPSGRRQKIFAVSRGLLVAITLVLTCISVKYGFELKVWTYTGKDPVGTYALKAKPFAGWLFDEFRGRIVDDLVVFINENIPPQDSLLVVTDLQILYALTGRPSYPGIPIQAFQKGDMPAPGFLLERVQKTIHQNLPDWIVLDIATYINEVPYLGLAEEMKSSYSVAKEFGPYAIFRKN